MSYWLELSLPQFRLAATGNPGEKNFARVAGRRNGGVR